MYTSEIIARAARGQAHGESRQQDLVPLLNTVVQILYKAETPQTMLFDAATGRLPTIQTVAGNFGPYDGPDNTWRIGNVLVWSENFDGSKDYGMLGTDEHDRVELDDYVRVNGNYYYRYNYTRTEDALEGGLPQLWFSRDPGNSTTHYYLQCYKNHPAVTSDRIQLLIPDSGGAHQTIVVPCLIKLLEAQHSGNYVEAIEYIEQTMKPRLWNMMSKGAHGARHQTTFRPY